MSMSAALTCMRHAFWSQQQRCHELPQPSGALPGRVQVMAGSGESHTRANSSAPGVSSEARPARRMHNEQVVPMWALGLGEGHAQMGFAATWSSSSSSGGSGGKHQQADDLSAGAQALQRKIQCLRGSESASMHSSGRHAAVYLQVLCGQCAPLREALRLTFPETWQKTSQAFLRAECTRLRARGCIEGALSASLGLKSSKGAALPV